MRKNLFYALPFMALAAFASCNKSSTTPSTGTTTPTPTPTVTYGMTAKINGTTYTATTATGINRVLSPSTAKLATVTGIFPYNGGNYSLVLGAQYYTGPKTYNNTDSSINSMVFSSNVSSGVVSYGNLNGGTLTITSDDGTTVKGTFTGKVYKGYDVPPITDSLNITEGTFTIKWQ